MNFHVATIGQEIGHIMASFKEYKIDKLLLLTSKNFEHKAKEVKEKVGFFKIDVDIIIINPFSKNAYSDIVNNILDAVKDKYEPSKTYINITGGTNLMSSAALTAAQFIGANAYYVIKGKTKDEFIEVPIVKLSLKDALTKKQRLLLKTLYSEAKKEGSIKNISDFASKYGTYKQNVLRPLSDLERLNLIKIDRSSRENVLRFTTTGELIIKMV